MLTAWAYSGELGGPPMAASQFRVVPPRGGVDWQPVIEDLRHALDGQLAIEARLAERARTYRRRRPVQAQPRGPAVGVVPRRGVAHATVIEVRAPNRIGVLHRIARALAEVGLDIRHATVQTLGEDVVDTFYVQGRNGAPHRRRVPPLGDRAGRAPRRVLTARVSRLAGDERGRPVDDGPEPFTRELARWSEALAAIARTGLGFTESLYERERFEEVLHIAADMKVAVNEVLGSTISPRRPPRSQREQDHFVQEWLESVGVGVPGYVTPKVAIGVDLGNDEGELLLVQRADSKVWLYPTGWADVGYSPSEVAVKEVLEETGIECEARRLVAVIDGQRMGFSRFGMYMLIFHCVRHRRRAAVPPAGVRRRRLVRPRRPAREDRRRQLVEGAGLRRHRRRGVPHDLRRGPHPHLAQLTSPWSGTDPAASRVGDRVSPVVRGRCPSAADVGR